MIKSAELDRLVDEFKQLQKDMKYLGIDIDCNLTNKMELEKTIWFNKKLLDEFPYARDLLADR
tara:strand:- start:920 stop:1108 length:189 start_codon:yes stop_codon:yes gene_type:complete